MNTQKTIYALGFFDGVHLGHQALLSACRDLAARAGCAAGVITFDTHPDTLVLGQAPALINTEADRARLLRRFGMENIIALPFDRAMMHLPWQDFVSLLLQQHEAAGFVVGQDFRFGHKGKGSAQVLNAFCRERGLACTVVSEQKLEDTVVSSTHIRTLLAEGKMEEAVRFLGHPHILTGTVISGRGLGHTMGIPTANLALPEGVAVPKFGVYACRCEIGGSSYAAVTNIGTRPTVGGHRITVEPWILDFDGDLYGKPLTLEFHKFLRPEKKFPDLAALQAEIRKNGEETQKFFPKK